MLATLTALVFSTSPAVEVRHLTASVVSSQDSTSTTKKKKKKKGAKSADKTADKTADKDTKPAETKAPETNEGLDLTAPPPAAASAAPDTGSDPEVASEAAKSQPPAPTEGVFSAVTPHTIGEDGNLVEGAVGYPGVYAGYWRGILAALDVGARVAFNYSYEGQFTRVTPGFHIQLQARYLFFDNGFLSVGATFAPGLIAYFLPSSGAHLGAIVPLTGVAGFKVMEKLNAAAMLEVPFWALAGLGAVLPLMVGGGAEYFLSDSLAVQAKVKFGVSIWLNGASPQPTLEGVAGVAWRL